MCFLLLMRTCYMQESFRHKNHEVSYALADTGLNRIRLPKPRPTRDLVASLIPDITSVSRDEDPEAYKLGGDAWLVCFDLLIV